MRNTDQTTPAVPPGERARVEPTETRSRRSAVRTLAAALVAFAGGGIAVADAKKKRPRKERPRGNPRKKCRRGRVIATLAVPADGSEISTPALKKGQRYTLRASGFWSTNGEFMNDAVAAFPNANPALPTFSDGGVRLGLSVNGRSPDAWGAYSPGHEYTMSVVGKGRRTPMRMQDSVYADNGRLLNVEVICG